MFEKAKFLYERNFLIFSFLLIFSFWVKCSSGNEDFSSYEVTFKPQDLISQQQGVVRFTTETNLKDVDDDNGTVDNENDSADDDDNDDDDDLLLDGIDSAEKEDNRRKQKNKGKDFVFGTQFNNRRKTENKIVTSKSLINADSVNTQLNNNSDNKNEEDNDDDDDESKSDEVVQQQQHQQRRKQQWKKFNFESAYQDVFPSTSGTTVTETILPTSTILENSPGLLDEKKIPQNISNEENEDIFSDVNQSITNSSNDDLKEEEPAKTAKKLETEAAIASRMSAFEKHKAHRRNLRLRYHGGHNKNHNNSGGGDDGIKRSYAKYKKSEHLRLRKRPTSGQLRSSFNQHHQQERPASSQSTTIQGQSTESNQQQKDVKGYDYRQKHQPYYYQGRVRYYYGDNDPSSLPLSQTFSDSSATDVGDDISPLSSSNSRAKMSHRHHQYPSPYQHQQQYVYAAQQLYHPHNSRSHRKDGVHLPDYVDYFGRGGYYHNNHRQHHHYNHHNHHRKAHHQQQFQTISNNYSSRDFGRMSNTEEDYDRKTSKWPHLSRVQSQLFEDEKEENLPPYIKKYNKRRKQLLDLLEGTMPPSSSSTSTTVSPSTSAPVITESSTSSEHLQPIEKPKNTQEARNSENKRNFNSKIRQKSSRRRYHNHRNSKWIMEDLFEEQRANPNKPNTDNDGNDDQYLSDSTANQGISSLPSRQSSSAVSSSSSSSLSSSSKSPSSSLQPSLRGTPTFSRPLISSSSSLFPSISSASSQQANLKEDEHLKALQGNELPGADISISLNEDEDENDDFSIAEDDDDSKENNNNNSNDGNQYQHDKGKNDNGNKQQQATYKESSLRNSFNKEELNGNSSSSAPRMDETSSSSLSSQASSLISSPSSSSSLLSDSNSKISSSNNSNNNYNSNNNNNNKFIYHRIDAPRVVGVGIGGPRKQRLPFVAITDRRLETSKMRQKDFAQNHSPPLMP